MSPMRKLLLTLVVGSLAFNSAAGVALADEGGLRGEVEGAVEAFFSAYAARDVSAVMATFSNRDDVMIYGSAATGYIAGAIEGGGSTGLTKPNEVMSYELGLKSTLADGTMRLNVAAFYNDYEGLTTSSFIAQGQTIVAVGSVGGTMGSGCGIVRAGALVAGSSLAGGGVWAGA